MGSPWFLVMMNDTYKDFFKSTRGLRQGDPISPYLFILIEDDLSWLLRRNFGVGRIRSFSHSLGAPLISHLLYAYDLLIFVNGEMSSVWRLMQILEIYERWSGQLISKEKTAFFFSKHISTSRRWSLRRLTSFVEVCFSVVYLGAPLVVRRLRVQDL